MGIEGVMSLTGVPLADMLHMSHLDLWCLHVLRTPSKRGGGGGAWWSGSAWVGDCAGVRGTRAPSCLLVMVQQ